MGSPPPGLTAAEAARRLAVDGPNELGHDPGPSAAALLASQFRNPMVALLLAAAAVAGALGEGVDAAAIGAIVVVNAAVGFAQEFRAERALHALRAMTAPRARVLRDGHPVVVAAREVVVGDVLLLEAGDLVAADARVVEASLLRANEATLTGESLPVHKSAEPAPPGAPLAERRDHVFLGTAIATGTALAEVVATGPRTETGRIAHLLVSASSSETPLQRQLAAVSRTLLWACLAVVAVVALLGLAQGRGGLEVVLAAVSLAVAAVPEGLPAIVTIALAVGVQRMAARDVLVRRLPAVEGLGAVTVVCTDKTGTLTAGVMSVREVVGPDPRRVLEVAAACCDAELTPSGPVGDPTEVAILERAEREGITRVRIETENPRRRTEPFDADTRRMVVERADGLVYVKGAPERVLADARSVPPGLAEALPELGRRALRVLAVARGPSEDALEVVGLLGLADPPRPEAVAAVAAARRGGIRTVMITGDHPDTARAIAEELGIVAPGEDPAGWVHARATPEDKIAIVRAWKARGAVVAMTGDGVNDAPAIREAHVGIAMGRTGTEVTREAGAIVLTDDNFASIVDGIREGRTIYANIRKTVVYLLSGNAAELLLMFGAALAGLPLPLLPLHLLWINLLTDGLPALALGMDPPDGDVLDRPPRPPDRPLLGAAEWRGVLLTGALEAAVVLGTFVGALGQGLDTARNLAFSTLVFSELFRSFAARSPERPAVSVGLGTNPGLLAVVGVSCAFQLAVQHLPAVAALFGVAPLSAGQSLASLALGLVPVTALELRKLVRPG